MEIAQKHHERWAATKKKSFTWAQITPFFTKQIAIYEEKGGELKKAWNYLCKRITNEEEKKIRVYSKER